MILKSLLFCLLLLTGSALHAQDTILLISGREIPVKNYKINDPFIEYLKSSDEKRVKTRLLEKADVFSVKKQDGTEEVIYEGDSLSFTVEQARNYIHGEQAAMKYYHKPANGIASAVVGAGSGVLSFYSLPVPMFYSVIIGRFNPKKMQIPDGYDTPSSTTEEFRFGYNKKVRNLKIQQSLKWGYIGLGLGLTGWIIYGTSQR